MDFLNKNRDFPNVMNSIRCRTKIKHTNFLRRIDPRYPEFPISNYDFPICCRFERFLPRCSPDFQENQPDFVIFNFAPPRRRRRRRLRNNFPSQPDPIPSRRDIISRSGPAPHSDFLCIRAPGNILENPPKSGSAGSENTPLAFKA